MEEGLGLTEEPGGDCEPEVFPQFKDRLVQSNGMNLLITFDIVMLTVAVLI